MNLASIPVMVQPNAGLPTIVNGETTFKITSDAFAHYMEHFATLGVAILGGCCGTEPSYIEKVRTNVDKLSIEKKNRPRLQGVRSTTKAAHFH